MERITSGKEQIIDPRQAAPIRDNIVRPYFGTRTSYFVYHPLYIYGEDSFWKTKDSFMKMYKDWQSVVNLYQDEMVLSETVTVPGLVKEIDKLTAEITKAQDVYLLEALAESLFDKDGAAQNPDGSFDGPSEKTKRHELPYMYELEQRAKELRVLDLGLSLGYSIPKKFITRHSWAG